MDKCAICGGGHVTDSCGEIAVKPTNVKPLIEIKPIVSQQTPFGEITVHDGRSLNRIKKDGTNLVAYMLHTEGSVIDWKTVRNTWPTSGAFRVEYGTPPPVAGLQKYMESAEFRTAMSQAGVSINETHVAISAEQQALLMDITAGGGTLAGKLKRHGISATVFRSWLRQPEFNRRYKSLADQSMMDAIPAAKARLAHQAESGDLKAIKYMFEITGEYNPRAQEAVDTQALIGIVIDTMMEKIKDPELLRDIKETIQFKAQAVKGVTINRSAM